MATERRRRAVATASTGAGLTVAGGVLRQQGLTAAHGGKHPPAFSWQRPVSTHQTRALLRTGARGRKRYLLGAGLGLVGAPALAVGIHDTFTREPVRKDRQRSFVHEGIRGTLDASEARAEGLKEVPPQHRAGPLAVSALAGAGGSLATHRTLDKLKAFHGARHSPRAGLAALGGTTAAALSYPVARHTVRSNEYEVTPTGVRRRKQRPVRPSSKSSRAQARPRSLTADMSKVHNPHSLTPTTSRGTPRKVHWRKGDADHAVCGLDGAFGRGTGPFAEHYGEVTCRGCARAMRIRKSDLDDARRRRNPVEAHRTKYRRVDEIMEDFHERIGEPLVHFKTEGIIRPREEMSRHLSGKVACGSEAARHVTEHHHEVSCPECLKRIRRGFGVVKAASDYSGRRTSTTAQRAAILAAGSTPVVGSLAGARTAGHFAPPGKRTKTEARQYGLTSGGSIVGGLAGAYGTSALATRHAGVARATERAASAHGRASEKVRNFKPVNATMARLPKGGRAAARVARTKEAARGSKLARPLMHSRASAIGAGVGYLAGKTVGGYAGSGIAMRRNQADQREFNLKHPVVKYVENMTVAERRKLSRKKRVAAASSTTTGVLGLGALAARAKKRPDLALNLLTGSAAIGGVNNLNFAGVLRREAKATDPNVKKGMLVAKAMGPANRRRLSRLTTHMLERPEKYGRYHEAGTPAQRVVTLLDQAGLPSRFERAHRRETGEWMRLPHLSQFMADQKYDTYLRRRLAGEKATPPRRRLPSATQGFDKADHREPLSRMRADQAAQIVRRHGDAGPLPSTLSRPERMQAYEARYVHAGGHKAEHWQRRADRADKVKVAGLAGATAGGAGIMTLRHPRVARALGRRLEHARHATDTATIGAATVSGAGELYAGHARRRRASYSNSKAGVAASALRRMRDYSA